MSSIDYLREFVNERLSVAAEEIFGVFKKTIVEYEEELDLQRRLLDIVWKPEVRLHRIDVSHRRSGFCVPPEFPQQHVCKEDEEKILVDQQLCNQETNSRLDQEDPEPPQIKEEQEELCTSQEGEQLVLKLEPDTFLLIPTYDESDQQLLNGNCNVAESHNQIGGNDGGAGSSRNAEPKPNERQYKRQSHSNNLYNSNLSGIYGNSHTGKKSFKCHTCGKAFKYKCHFKVHMRSHSGEKLYSCDTCGRRFSCTSVLKTHIRIHTGERPYSCKTCGRDFRRSSDLVVHIRTHTGEKPYICATCGKGFTTSGHMRRHMRIHTSEKPYLCNICGKRFIQMTDLKMHARIHTGEKTYSCKTWGTFESPHGNAHRQEAAPLQHMWEMILPDARFEKAHKSPHR